MHNHPRYVLLGTTLLLLSCSKSEEPDEDSATVAPQAIHFSGALDPDYNAARGAASAQVDAIVALPNDRANIDSGIVAAAQVFPLGDDGAWDIEVSTAHDWIFFLVASEAENVDKIRGFVTVGNGDDTMVNFPISDATGDIDVGTVAPSGDEALGDTSLADTTASFTLDLTEMESLAEIDGFYKGMSNAWVNHDPDAGTWWMSTLTANFRANLDTFGTSTPSDFTYAGYGLLFETNTLQLDTICDGTVVAELRPSRLMWTTGGTLIYSNVGLQSVGMEDRGGACAGDEMLVSSGGDSVSLLFPSEEEWFSDMEGTDPWRILVDGTDSAWFQMEFESPVDDQGGIYAPFPAASINEVNGASRLTIDWYIYDGTDYQLQSDPQWLQRIIRSVSIEVRGTSPNEELVVYDVDEENGIPTELDFDGEWTVGGTVEGVTVAYQVGMANVSFEWTSGAYCGNQVVDGNEACDAELLSGETCASLGYAAGELACDNACRWDVSSCDAADVGSWRAGGAMSMDHWNHTATKLADGRVLIAGGSSTGGTTASAELYDPDTNSFTQTGSMAEARSNHTATLLWDGRVLIVGGTGLTASDAELYDPSAGTFSSISGPPVLAYRHTASLLPDQRVLVVGTGVAGRTAYFSPADGDTWTEGNPVAVPRSGATLTEIHAGEFVLFGGSASSIGPVDQVEIFDSSDGSWRLLTETSTLGRNSHESAFLASSTEILVGGGVDAVPGCLSCGAWATYYIDHYDAYRERFWGRTKLPTRTVNSVVALDSGHGYAFGFEDAYIYYPRARTVGDGPAPLKSVSQQVWVKLDTGDYLFTGPGADDTQLFGP